MAAVRSLLSAAVLLSIHVSLVLAQIQYASPPTPTVPNISASSSWLTISKPSATASHKGTISQIELLSSFSRAKIAHAILGVVAFLFVFPLGGIIIKVWPHRHIVWIHAAIQAAGLALYIACAGLGIWMGVRLYTLNRYHAVLGYVVLAFLVIQPLLKLHWFHSSIPRVAFFMHIHLWLGRIILMLGIIDGGLGFRISESLGGPRWHQGWKIAYGVVGGIVWVVYVGVCVVWVELKKVPRAAPVSPGAPPAEVLALAEQEDRQRLKAGETVVTASAVESDVESGNGLPVTPRRPSRALGF